jgi:C2 domain
MPRWHKFKLKPDAPGQGELLVSFTINDLDYPFKVP